MGARSKCHTDAESKFIRLAIGLARRGYGAVSPNPMVGAVLVRGGRIIGRGWHRRAGGPHAEVEAIRDALRRGNDPKGATLYVTLEPCCTHGRTPPCTDAIIAAGIKRVVVGATDPNPKHCGKAFKILRRAGIEAAAPCRQDRLAEKCARLNEAFNHWIVHRTPFVTVKAAMTLDGKIATASGESKWITGEKARDCGMKLRQGADAILVGINTVLADDPSLTFRGKADEGTGMKKQMRLRRIVLDANARTPLDAKVASDKHAALTTVVVSKTAPSNRVTALAKRVNVIAAPLKKSQIANRKTCPAKVQSEAGSQINLRWLLKKLGAENVTSLLVEGGGEVNASFLVGGFAHRVVFFYAPKIPGGRDSRRAVAGDGAARLAGVIELRDVEWRKLGDDLMMTAKVER
jgi:diaminohydroxyphosphoribosylaminopyrimidine deaminase/5-amino-6-(5-phosphoribosylamino)uracil reductase